MAAMWKLPIMFVVENNLWAIGMLHLRATSELEIWKKGSASAMPGVFRGHSLANPDELWHPVEKARYAARDPLKALKKYLIENNVVNDKELKAKCYCFT
ncbi:hypothetical protein VitviT2T_001911 [Vitis vinifera]|uniref:Dehydrogenase E1 component domain-containing protein n=1 Tax=Vitis vinifera TaxID=29760 RepID=A0ABY9BIB4_VITVI|nr:hypothetical protein VitviT2T_001911 [Vitis vinifera]